MYEPRRAANDASRAGAENLGELWDEREVEILEQCWGDIPIEEIAEALARTIEACREKHYDLARKQHRTVQEKEIKSVSQWSRGFTSLKDMGF